MKNILLLINNYESPFSDFAVMFENILKETSQFSLDVTNDRNKLCDLSKYDAVALYISSGDLSLEQEEGIIGPKLKKIFTRNSLTEEQILKLI